MERVPTRRLPPVNDPAARTDKAPSSGEPLSPRKLPPVAPYNPQDSAEGHQAQGESPVYLTKEEMDSRQVHPADQGMAESTQGYLDKGPGTYGAGSGADTMPVANPNNKPSAGYQGNDVEEGLGCGSYCLLAFSYIIIALTFPFSLCAGLKIVQEYERAVIFRLGRLLPGGAKGPGLFFVVPCTDSYRKVDLRTVSFDVPPQEILSKDSVTISVDAVVYYRVQDATISITNVENAHRSTRLLAQTTLRNVLGTKNLADILADRETISNFMQETLDEATDPWGVMVERVEMKDVRLPVQLQRAMAAEAEASREARAKVIAAEGEMNASKALREAADIIGESSSALQLRYLQTLNSISAEKNSTIIFPLPMDLMKGFLKK